MNATIAAITDDALVLRNLARTAAERGETLVTGKSVAALQADLPLIAVVIDLDVKDGLRYAAEVKERWPTALIAGFLSYPNRKLWEAAEAAGMHLVATRGALAAQLREKLKDWRGSVKRRVRLGDAADFSGRLGVVARLSDLPVGPIAVYHLGGELFAVQDVCPHAGARLSEGELSGAVITCPRHGSQFDVRTGERVRGPADLEIETYRVEIDGGQIFLELG